jgi:hypothetical protein
MEISAESLPPPATGGLTVKVWSATRAAERLRRIA